jgi:hypothetical protein
MANREITRNVFRQIISNGLDPNGVFTDYESHLLEMGLTVFNQNDYDRILERVSDTFIFDEGQLPDISPSIISEIGFIDKNLFTIDGLVTLTMYGGGQFVTLDPTKGNFIRGEFKTDVLDQSHALTPSNFETEFNIVYQSPLTPGSQLKVAPSGQITTFDVLSDFIPGPTTRYHCVKEFDETVDTTLASLVNGGSGLNRPQKLLLQRVLNDKRNGGWSAFGNEKEEFEKYDNKPFTSLILEVDNQGRVQEVHKVGGRYKNGGESGKSPGVSFTATSATVGINFGSPEDAYRIITFTSDLL